ncbi:MAG: acyl carrier protein [Acidobacteria bacterium]|nr:MAG: acyl carrier protein [Acidobacteriota bacterium]
MKTSDLEARVRQVLTKSVGVPPEKITLDAKLVDDLGLDSVDLVELTIAAEREFDITISDEGMKESLTVADVANLVKRLTDK